MTRPSLLRLLLSIPIATFLLGAPLHRLVTGEQHPYLRGWAMFEGAGYDVCSVVLRDDRGAPLDRYAPFGATGFRDAPARIRFLSDLEEASAVASEMCPAVHPGTVIRVEVRCPEPSGWVPWSTREIACPAPAKGEP